MMTIDDYRLLAMTPSQAHREKRILEKSAENRQKSEEIGMNAEKITEIEENEKSVPTKIIS